MRIEFEKDLQGILLVLGEAGAEFGVPLYLVGGAVRDLLAPKVSAAAAPDIDVMVEGDGHGFVKWLFENWGRLAISQVQPLKPILFKKFLTAKLPFHGALLPGIDNLDFSTARKEVYPAPGAQPAVTPGDAQSDLFRRDFSVNAMAVQLAPNRFGELLDPFGGCDDLKNRLLTVLHDKSFVDDPARIIRGRRFATRCGFNFSGHTEELARVSIAASQLELLPRFRLLDEFKKAFNEERLLSCVTDLNTWGLIRFLDSKFEVGSYQIEQLTLLETLDKQIQLGAERHFERWEIVMAVLSRALDELRYAELLKSFELGARTIDQLLSARTSWGQYASRVR